MSLVNDLQEISTIIIPSNNFNESIVQSHICTIRAINFLKIWIYNYEKQYMTIVATLSLQR